nr:MAG TPA: hypothetical protein [Caudoviricetes sp.]
MYGKLIYSCLIQYLLNDLYSGIKKNSQLKADCSKFQSIKKRNITQQYYNVFGYEKKGTSHNV